MITAHTIIKNEEHWIWYSIMSVLDFVDEILVWDTGSTDRTVDIVKSISSPKIRFRQYGEVDAIKFTTAHNEMLANTSPGWLLTVDGDEIWPYYAIKNLTAAIITEGDKYDFFVGRNYNLLGDVYHYQEELAGRYHIGKYMGHYNVRAVNIDKNSGLHFDKPHGQIGLFDKNNNLIQTRLSSVYKLVPGSYFHATHLIRSKNRDLDKQVIKRTHKFKFELGIPFADKFRYPEVFYLPHPSFVPSPWTKRTFSYELKATIQSPLKIIKRRLVKNPVSGY